MNIPCELFCIMNFLPIHQHAEFLLIPVIQISEILSY